MALVVCFKMEDFLKWGEVKQEFSRLKPVAKGVKLPKVGRKNNG